MKNRYILPGLSAGLGLVVAITAYGMGSFQLECTREAVLRRADAEIELNQQYNSDVQNAREERRNRLEDAWQIADDRERNDELRQIEKEYNDTLRELKRSLRDAERELRNQYNEDVRECRNQQRELCQPIQCDRGRVPSCDRDGNPIEYYGDPCEDQRISSSSSRSSRSSRISSRSSRISSRSSRSSSRSSRSSRVSSRPLVCGDGICEGNENLILCPVCASWNNDDDDDDGRCRCHRHCEEDCGRP